YTGEFCETEINECESQPCFFNGTCVDLINNFRCECTGDFMGPQCEAVIRRCELDNPDPCLNGGTCVDETGGYRCLCPVPFAGLDCQLHYRCQCSPGWTGQQCETDVNECLVGASSPSSTHPPCENGGQCVNVAGGYMCVCPVFWTGQRCETDALECDGEGVTETVAGKGGKYCQNNGTCVEQTGAAPLCQCTSGEYCEREINECSFGPCRNNATCVNLVNSFTCICPPGFTGIACDVDLDECQSTPCADGSTCVDLPDGFTCVCPTGTTGSYVCNCVSGISGANCEIVQTANFNGFNVLQLSSLAQLAEEGPGLLGTRRRKRDVGSLLQIRFTFTTTVPKGVLLFATGTSSGGRPQHVGLELYSGSLHYTQSDGTYLVGGALPLPDPGLDLHSLTVDVLITTTLTSVTFDPHTCSGDPDCSLTLPAPSNSTQLDLTGVTYFGGVAHVTPYMRSKLRSVDGFTGCLGNLLVNGYTAGLMPEPSTDVNSPTTSTTPPGTPATTRLAPTPGCRTHEPCLDTMCQNGGRCVDLWTSRHCQCATGYTGDHCTFQNMAHFETESMMHFGSYGEITELSFWITATRPDGLILYTVTTDTVALMLDGGQLRLHLVSRGSDIVSRVGSDLANGDWVRVGLTLGNGRYSLQVYRESDGLYGTATGTVANFILVTRPLFVGRLHHHPATNTWTERETPLPTTNSFQGCIRDLTISYNPVDLLSHEASVFGNDPPLPLPGCPREETCSEMPCQNGGECQTQWGGHSCRCAPGFRGDNCTEAVSVTFDGSSSHVTMLIDRTKIGFGDNGGFQFRTRGESSTLMLLQFLSLTGGSDRFLEFRLYQGRVQVFSSFSQSQISSLVRLSDGAWHSVTWRRIHSYLLLTFDGVALYLRANMNPFDPRLNQTVQVYLGARPFKPGDDSHLVSHFKGCMRNLTFNQVTVPFVQGDSSPAGVTVRSDGLRPDCVKDDVCDVNPCPANSYCHDNWNAYTCPWWEGLHCEVNTDDCAGGPCLNQGNCTDLVDGFQCLCPDDYFGDRCEHRFICSSQPCFNGGTCTPDETNSNFVCQCTDEYRGEFCQTYNYCRDHRCMNNATCVIQPDSYGCQCPPGYYGVYCQFYDFCQSGPCLHEAVCRRSKCESVADACFSQPCFNNGRCSYRGFCSCPDVIASCGWHNGTCQQDACTNRNDCYIHPTPFTCDCEGTGFAGAQCTVDVDECKEVGKCLNGGACENTIGGFLCWCQGTGYRGDRCQDDRDECNGTSGTDSFRCTCDGTGYHGDTCEKDVDECAEGQHNCSQDDPCVNLLGGYRCGCQEGDEGALCQALLGGATSDNTTGILVACIVIIVVILAVAGYAAWHFRRSRKRKGHYRPSEAEQNNATGIPMDKMADTFGERLI
ncbi:hypothetical protein BaRGS_00003639, partial [Batillaria attramentaria]